MALLRGQTGCGLGHPAPHGVRDSRGGPERLFLSTTARRRHICEVISGYYCSSTLAGSGVGSDKGIATVGLFGAQLLA